MVWLVCSLYIVQVQLNVKSSMYHWSRGKQTNTMMTFTNHKKGHYLSSKINTNVLHITPCHLFLVILSLHVFQNLRANFVVIYLYVFKKGSHNEREVVEGVHNVQCAIFTYLSQKRGFCLVSYQVIASDTSHPNLVISPKCP